MQEPSIGKRFISRDFRYRQRNGSQASSFVPSSQGPTVYRGKSPPPESRERATSSEGHPYRGRGHGFSSLSIQSQPPLTIKARLHSDVVANIKETQTSVTIPSALDLNTQIVPLDLRERGRQTCPLRDTLCCSPMSEAEAAVILEAEAAVSCLAMATLVMEDAVNLEAATDVGNDTTDV